MAPSPAALGFTTNPAAAGSFSGRLAIFASGRCLWDDIKSLPEYWIGADAMAVKAAGLYLPFEFEHWVGCHGERFEHMVPLRSYHMHRGKMHAEWKGLTHSDAPGVRVNCVWPGKVHGTSGLLAAKVGLALGYEEVLLCGMPLDGTGRFYDPPWAEGRELLDMTEWQRLARDVFDGRVKSMSGKTRELLGGP